VTVSAYHGHTTAVLDLSPYKTYSSSAAGTKPWIHVASHAVIFFLLKCCIWTRKMHGYL